MQKIIIITLGIVLLLGYLLVSSYNGLTVSNVILGLVLSIYIVVGMFRGGPQPRQYKTRVVLFIVCYGFLLWRTPDGFNYQDLTILIWGSLSATLYTLFTFPDKLKKMR